MQNKFWILFLTIGLVLTGCTSKDQSDTNLEFTPSPSPVQNDITYYRYTRDIPIESTDTNIFGLGTVPVNISAGNSNHEQYMIEEWLINLTDQKIQSPTGASMPLPTSHSEAAKLFDFKIVDKKAIIDFKFVFMLEGDLSGAYITNELRLTLLPFDSIDQLEIRVNGSKCWDDLSGLCTE